MDTLFTDNAEPDHWAQAADDDDRISNGLMEPDQARLTLGLPPKATRDQTMAADRMTQLNRAIETLRRIEDPSGPRSSRRCRSRWLR